MAERHDINIVISKTGEVHLEVKGIKGTRCLDITKDIEEELGILIDREKTSDYYNDVNDTNINISNQG